MFKHKPRVPQEYTEHEYKLKLARIIANVAIVLLLISLSMFYKVQDTNKQNQANYNDSVATCVDSGQSPMECKAALEGGN